MADAMPTISACALGYQLKDLIDGILFLGRTMFNSGDQATDQAQAAIRVSY